MSKTPTLSDVLRKTVAQSGLPLLTLEQETGVARASIMRFLRGAQGLSLRSADRLAAYFGLELVATNRPGHPPLKPRRGRKGKSDDA